MDIKELPQKLELKWDMPEEPESRHLSTEVMPLSEYLAMRKRIGGRNALMPRTNFSIEPLEKLKETDEVMLSFKDEYVFSSHTAEPETLLFLKSAIEMFRPRAILELGCGLSTLVLSAAQKEVLKADKEKGVYVTIEQDREHLDKVLEFAEAAKVRDFFKPLVFPMVRYKVGDMFDTEEKAMPCYDLDEKLIHKALGGVRPDMIVIDGPVDEKSLSGASFSMALTLPLLSLYAAPGAVILMNGVYTDPEIFAMEQWQASGIANIIGIKAVGKGLMIAIMA